MKLQKQFAYEYGGAKHFKFLVIIPEEMIKKLNWNEGENLIAEVKGYQLIFRRGVIIKSKKEIMPYSKFKDTIKRELIQNPSGLTWTQIKNKTGLKQKVPNNRWVKMMCKDINLVREKKDRRTIWKLK